jgi:hypothetical protein
VKGNAYRGFVTLVGKVVPGGMDTLVAMLAERDLRDFVKQPFLASARYDILPLVPLCAAVARILGVQLDGFVRSTTRKQAQYDARTVYKRIFDTESIADLSERFARFNENYYDFGRYESALTAPGRLMITHAEIPAYLRPWHLPMHVAYAEAAMEIAGAKEIKVLSSVVTPAGARAGFPLITSRTELR